MRQAATFANASTTNHTALWHRLLKHSCEKRFRSFVNCIADTQAKPLKSEGCNEPFRAHIRYYLSPPDKKVLEAISILHMKSEISEGGGPENLSIPLDARSTPSGRTRGPSSHQSRTTIHTWMYKNRIMRAGCDDPRPAHVRLSRSESANPTLMRDYPPWHSERGAAIAPSTMAAGMPTRRRCRLRRRVAQYKYNK